MNLWTVNRIMDRLNQMLEHAMNGEPVETGFDETKMSALETKMMQYLQMNHTRETQLKEENLRINELISDISHQTKTSIASLMLYTQLLEESNPTESQQQCIAALEQQTEKLNFLITALRKISQLENGVIFLRPKKQPVRSLLEQVYHQALPKAQKLGIKLSLEADREIYACYDLKWTTEALFNLVDNAIKYSMAEQEVSIRVTVYSMFCRIDVVDWGIGIAKEEQPKIFSRFYRSEAVHETEGVGLGLYLTREILAQEDGYMKVESEREKGSVFSVFLPTCD